MRTESQKKSILKYLEKGNSITPIEALRKFDSWALAQRIQNLRDDGHNISTTMIKETSGKTYASYKLEKS